MTLVLRFQGLRKERIQAENLESLRPIAKRQIESLLRRLASTKNYTLYWEEIQKVIEHEQEIVGGDTID